ncbi:MAG: lipoyl(octanoyl) transferase, partial [Phycisphaeraceae bacterium]
MVSASRSVEVHDLGGMAYAPALEVQRAAHAEVLEWRDGADMPIGRLYLVEHVPPVITISRRPESRQHLIALPGVLERAGVEIHETDRGGDITYHGPGQLVVYPILDLNRLGLNLHG